MATKSQLGEMLRAVCLEMQLGYPNPRNAQDCVDLANAVLQASMIEFANDRIIQSSIGVATEGGFRINLAFEESGQDEEEKE